MLKDLFSNRLFIGALALFVLCVGGSLLYQQHVIRETADDLARTEARLKQLTSKQNPNPTAQVREGDTSQGGHVHADGTWHEGAHETEVQSTPAAPDLRDDTPLTSEKPDPYAPIPEGIVPDWAAMSPEELASRIEAIADSRLFAPDGYDYKMRPDGTVILDENGYPVIHRRGDPFFTVNWGEGFRPTPEQYAEYKALHKRYMQAGIDGSPEEERLGEQLWEMRQTYSGEVPFVSWSFGVPVGTDMKAYHNRAAARATEIEHQAYREAGLGYLLD